jgi:hypothetical protein
MVCCRVHIRLFRLLIDLLLISNGFEGGHFRKMKFLSPRFGKTAMARSGSLALKATLRMSFPADYRRDASINITATASAQQAAVVVTEERRQRLIALRKRLLSESTKGLPHAGKRHPDRQP